MHDGNSPPVQECVTGTLLPNGSSPLPRMTGTLLCVQECMTGTLLPNGSLTAIDCRNHVLLFYAEFLSTAN